MPFDASGNFTRNYNFQQDRDNGIKILAARVDGEFDNVATGMNLVFFRDGRVPMQADLRMNINGIQGLKDGALGSPAIKFNTDANTGVYLDGLNRYAVQVNSVQRGVFTTTGFDVAGNFTASGTISEGGTSLTTKYLTASNPVFTGTLTGPAHVVSGASGSYTLVPRDGTVGNTVIYSNTASNMRIALNGSDYLVLSPGALTATGTVTGTTGLVAGSNTGAANVQVNGPSGSARGYGFQTAGTYVADVSLMTDNTTLRYSGPSIHQFYVAGTEYARVSTGGVSSPAVNVTGASGALTFAPRDATGGTAIIYSPTNKSISLNDGAGSDIVQFNASGTANLIKSGYIAGGVQGSYNVGYSNSRTGQVGYHMYNGGGVTEWITYQPAHATGDEFRIAKGAAGALADVLKLGTDNNTYILGSASVKNELWLGQNDTTGVLRFGNTAGSSTKYLWYDGTQFQLSAALVVGGNISSSSDIRLKSNVRPLENGMATVRALQGKRFTMYGKPDLGFVAQDVERVLPEVVSRDSKGYLSVDYGRLTAVLAEAVKSLDDRLSAVERFLVV